MAGETPWTVTQADREIAARAYEAAGWEILTAILPDDLAAIAAAISRHESQAALVEALREARDCIAHGNGLSSLDGFELPVFTMDDTEELVAKIDTLLAEHTGAA